MTVRPATDADLPLLGPLEDTGDRQFADLFGELDWPPAATGAERAAEAEVLARGGRELTLMTYADVPWNGPFYAARGWVEVAPPDRLAPMLAAEARMGLARHGRRIVVRRDLG